jgi:glycosyltransferase involved in cell wall biosynthesis
VPPSILVLIPAFNEAQRVGAVVEGVRRQVPEAAVLVVDDGSRDETAAVARSAGADVVRHPFNLGYGSALQTGYHYARRHGFARLVQLDADGQHDPSSVPRLLEALDRGSDVVVGSRYLPRRDGTARPPRTSLARRFGSWLFARLVTAWTGVRITDPTSGFQAMSARALEQLVLDNFPEDYPDADVLITLSRAGMRLCEMPVDMHERKGGVSMHRGGRVAYYVYKMFLTLALLPVRRRSPYRSGRRVPVASS